MLLASAAAIPLGVLLIVTDTRDAVAIAGISVIAFAFQSWIVNLHTIPSDAFAKQDAGAVFGIGGTSAGIVSMLFTLLVGWIVDRHGYTPVDVMVGLMAPIGARAFRAIMGRTERVAD